MTNLETTPSQANERIVISLGGSMLFLPGKQKIDEHYLKGFCSLLEARAATGKKIIVVVGGGARAKRAAEKARAKTANEFFADREAIKATRKNAKLLIKQLGDKAFPRVVKSPDDAAKALEAGKIGVSGGFLEGITTDACSVIIAERISAREVVNVSNTDGVYDHDPKTVPGAKKFSEMTHQQLIEVAVRGDDRRARVNFIFDLVACKLSARSNISVHFVKGSELHEVEKALKGEAHGGTVVKD